MSSSLQMRPVIEIRDIAKHYRLGEKPAVYGNLREVIAGGVKAPWRWLSKGRANPRPGTDGLWALKDINLDVYSGDTVAIIGSNGAGKSTLLKILSRITDPTKGSVTIRGRMASLLEVGTGFHPELTGRENIYLNGAILGMHKSEIDAKFDEIIAFAGIDRFLDTPVKRYSSGMYVRLAFSIAAHLEPEILVVDEVLAVGDVAFQKKCLGKMAEAYSKNRTVLFVSHNLAAVESLCNRAVVLQQGEIVFTGTAKEGIRHYLSHLSKEADTPGTHIVDLRNARGRPAKYRPQLERVELYSEGGVPYCGNLPVGASLKAFIYFNLAERCTSFDASLAFDTVTGQRVCTAHSAYEPGRSHDQRAGQQVFICEIPSMPLVPGNYRIHVALDIGGHEADLVENAASLSIIRSDYYGTGVVPTKGAFLVQNKWALAEEPAKVGA